MNERQEIVNLFRTAGLDVNAGVYLLAVSLLVCLGGQALAGVGAFLTALYFLRSARSNVHRAEGLNAYHGCFTNAEIDYLWNNC
jgi:hypothetical protein